jgi:hypothetical protein
MSIASAHRLASLARRSFHHWSLVLLAAEAGALRQLLERESRLEIWRFDLQTMRVPIAAARFNWWGWGPAVAFGSDTQLICGLLTCHWYDVLFS